MFGRKDALRCASRLNPVFPSSIFHPPSSSPSRLPSCSSRLRGCIEQIEGITGKNPSPLYNQRPTDQIQPGVSEAVGDSNGRSRRTDEHPEENVYPRGGGG